MFLFANVNVIFTVIFNRCWIFSLKYLPRSQIVGFEIISFHLSSCQCSINSYLACLFLHIFSPLKLYENLSRDHNLKFIFSQNRLYQFLKTLVKHRLLESKPCVIDITTPRITVIFEYQCNRWNFKMYNLNYCSKPEIER